MRVWSQRLIAHEAGKDHSSEVNDPAAFLAFEKLYPHLASLMGKVGVNALVSRALALANAEVPSLRAVRVNAEGALERLTELEAQFDHSAVAEGRLVLLARILDLLVVFIGEHLTERIVGDVWPQFPPNKRKSTKGGKR